MTPAPHAPLNPFSPPTHKDVLELQHPRGFRGRYGHPDHPLLHKKQYVHLSPSDPGLRFDSSFEEDELRRQQLRYLEKYPPVRLFNSVTNLSRSEGRYPDRAAFNVWPPTFIAPGSIQDRQLKPLFEARPKDKPSSPPPASSPAGSAVNTPGSTHANTPVVEGVKDVVASAPEAATETAAEKEKQPCKDTATVAAKGLPSPIRIPINPREEKKDETNDASSPSAKSNK